MTALHTNTSRSFILFLVLGALLTVFPLVVDFAAWNRFFEGIFLWVPGHPPGKLEGFSEVLAAPVFLWHPFSYMIGTAICSLCVGWLLLRYGKNVISPILLIPLLCDIYVFAQALPLLGLPSGAHIRSMGVNPLTFLLACGMTVFGLIYVTTQQPAQQSKILRGIGMLLSLLPIPIMMSSLSLMASIKGFKSVP
jgi:hypothetical protein